MDQGQDLLIKQLYATLDPDPNGRKGAEEALQYSSLQTGFGMALTMVTLNNDQPYGIKQLAAVLLKKYVKEHWQEGTRKFIPPEVGPEEKAAIRGALPAGLADPLGKIRTAVGMAIAGIAEHDWPQHWPDLTATLLHGIRDKSNPNAVHGALKCLSMIAQDIDEAQMPMVVPHLFPELHAIVSHPEAYGPSLQRRAMGVLAGCVSALGVMRGAYRQQVSSLLTPLLSGMVTAILGLIARPLCFQDVADIGCKMEAFRTLTTITQNFGKLIGGEMPAVVAGTWGFLSGCVAEYEATAVHPPPDLDFDVNEVDSDGDELNLESLMSQVWEFVLTVAGSSRFQSLVAPQMTDMTYLLSRYMQMTRAQEVAWANDPDQFVADEEDDTVSVRVSGEMLLQQCLESFGPEATLTAVWTVTMKRFAEADQARQAGAQHAWWRVRESVMLMLGAVSEPLVENLGNSQGQELQQLRHQLLTLDLAQGTEQFPFLRGRALWLASKLHSQGDAAASQDMQHLPFMQASLVCLSPSSSSSTPSSNTSSAHNTLPLRIAACRCLAALAPRTPTQALMPLMPQVYEGLIALLREASEEIVHLVLECITEVVKAEPHSASQVLPTLAPVLLQVWAGNVTDPLVSQDALETINALASIPHCLIQLLQQALPAISAVLQQPSAHPEALVEGSLDLLPSLLRPAQVEQIKQAHAELYPHILALGMSSEDSGVLQSVAEVIRLLLVKAGPALMEWGMPGGGDANQALQAILQVIGRLLNPSLEDSAAMYVGGLLRTLVRVLPEQMSPLLPQILSALVSRLSSAQVPHLKTTLVLVFASLAHISPSGLISCLKSLPAPEGQPNTPALTFVMSEWVHWQSDIQGAYEIKLSTTALAKVLASGDPALGEVHVQGEPIVNQEQGIMTRSRARAAGPQLFTTVPLPAKIFSLLADALYESLEQQRGVKCTGKEEDDDDEWEAEDDDDEDDDEGYGGPCSVDFFEKLLAEGRFEDEGTEDMDAQHDPVNQTDIVEFLGGYLKGFATQDRASFDRCMQGLNAKHAQAVNKMLA